MDLILKLKRFVRSNKLTRKFADKLYLRLTGQLKEERHLGNGGAVYYIIRPPKCKIGLMGLYIDTIEEIEYALTRGYRPVVDYLNYQTVYSGESFQDNANVWEWYFEQPFGYSLDEAYNSNYILSPMAVLKEENITDDLLKGSTEILRRYAELAQNVKLSAVARNHIDNLAMTRRGGHSSAFFAEGATIRSINPLIIPFSRTEISLSQWFEKRWNNGIVTPSF